MRANGLLKDRVESVPRISEPGGGEELETRTQRCGLKEITQYALGEGDLGVVAKILQVGGQRQVRGKRARNASPVAKGGAELQIFRNKSQAEKPVPTPLVEEPEQLLLYRRCRIRRRNRALLPLKKQIIGQEADREFPWLDCFGAPTRL